VWHLHNGQEDSEPGNHDGTKYDGTNQITRSAPGIIGNAEVFNKASNSWIRTTLPRAFTTDFTWSSWFRTTSDGTLCAKCDEFGVHHPGAKSFFVQSGAVVFDIGWLGQIRWGSGLNNGNWHYAVATTDVSGGNDVTRIYVDGIQRASTTWDSNSQGESGIFKIGMVCTDGWPTQPSNMEGLLDEVRVSTPVRSSNWVWACWMTVASNSTFTTYGRGPVSGTLLLFK